MPAMFDATGMTRSTYGGTVLRFESDGTVPADNHAGSPILARGYALPTSLAWSPSGNDLWLSGMSSDLAGPLARLPLGTESAEWPRSPAASRLSNSVSTGTAVSEMSLAPSIFGGDVNRVLVVNDSSLLWVEMTPGDARVVEQMPAAEMGGRPVAVTVAGSRIYVALGAGGSATASDIVLLRKD